MASVTAFAGETSRTHRYTSVAIALHWTMALAMLGLIGGGWAMTGLANDHPMKEGLYQIHKSVGVTILILTLARIAWRVMNPPPPEPDSLTHWERVSSHGAHIAFYALMIALPLTGWLYVSTAYEFDVPTVLYGVVSWPDLPFLGALSNPTGHGAFESAHSILAFLAAALIAVHVAGALKHELGAEEGVLKRMAPVLFGSTAGPKAPPRGAMAAFGGAFAVFLVVSGAPLLTQAGPADLATTSSLEPNWALDPNAERRIGFSGVHDGNPYSGQFDRWDAVIAFDPAALDASRVEVTVDLGSAMANTKLYTDSLRSAEWLDVGGSPTATVIVDGFEGPGPNYTANAALSLKGATVTVPLNFELVIDGDRAALTGNAAFSRAELDVGMVSDPGADWVDDEIAIDVSLSALRIAD
ncbi:MAG: cytochrome b/b6 domain-containing protein [Pseudomonadota bacterium]